MLIGIDARELQGRPTGTGRYLRNLLRVWTRSTEDSLIAYFNGPAPFDRVLDHPAVRKRPLGEKSSRGLWWQEKRLPPAVREDQVEVFFSPAYTCPLSLRVPRVTAVHDFSFFSIPHDFSLLDGIRRRFLVAASLSASRRILACSDFTRREIASRFPELRDRILHVPLGADDDLAPPSPREQARARLRLAGPFLLTVGAVLNRRRLPALLGAVKRLLRLWPTLTLDVVGDNRTHPRLDLFALVRNQGLRRHVRICGFVSEAELADRYAAADVAIFLSEYEGFGLPVLEAMARGVPVVTSVRPCLGEIFGGAALLVEPGDTPGIADAIDRLLRDHALRADLTAKGRALARGYSWEQAAARTRAALASAAGD